MTLAKVGKLTLKPRFKYGDRKKKRKRRAGMLRSASQLFEVSGEICCRQHASTNAAAHKGTLPGDKSGSTSGNNSVRKLDAPVLVSTVLNGTAMKSMIGDGINSNLL